MTELTPAADAAPRSLNLVQRVVGIIFSPRATYQSLAARPVFGGTLVLLILLGAGVSYWLLGSESGRQLMIAAAEQSMREAEAQGNTISPEQRRASLMFMQYIGIGSAVAQVVLTPLLLAVLASILMAVLNALYGAQASFRHLYTVVTHAWLIPSLTGLITTPLMLAKQEMSSTSSLAVLLPTLQDGSFVTYFLGAIDLVWIWFFVNLAIGLAVLYKRKTGPVAATFFVIYGTVALLYATARSL
jgi:hypothetical protein